MASGMAAQLMATNGPAARALLAWMNRASTSLPVPVGPAIRTGMSLAATRCAKVISATLPASAQTGVPGAVAAAITAALLAGAMA